MSENTKLVIFLIITLTIFVALGQAYRQFRSFRLKKLAIKYKLDYSKNFMFFYPDTKKFNLIQGNINGIKINIYDSVSRKIYSNVGSGIFAYQTIIQIGGSQIQTKVKHFTNIKSIENELKNILK